MNRPFATQSSAPHAVSQAADARIETIPLKVGGLTPSQDAERVRALRAPISAGQSELSRFGCRDLMATGAIDICNFDASWGGGPTEWLRVAALAQEFNVGVAQHIEPQIGAMLVAGARNGTFAEMLLPWRDPFFGKLIANQTPFNAGKYLLPNQPGWGLSFDTDYPEYARRKD